jgi:hypothetical protein
MRILVNKRWPIHAANDIRYAVPCGPNQPRRFEIAWRRQARAALFYKPPIGLRFRMWLNRRAAKVLNERDD